MKESDLHELYELQVWLEKSNLHFTIDPRNPESIYQLIAFLAKRKWFSLAQECPACSSPHYCRNGTYHQVFHRYKCLDCGKKFNDLTGTPLGWVHHPSKALRFIIHYLNSGKSNIKIAHEIAVSKNTVSKWKRRFG